MKKINTKIFDKRETDNSMQNETQVIYLYSSKSTPPTLDRTQALRTEDESNPSSATKGQPVLRESNHAKEAHISGSAQSATNRPPPPRNRTDPYGVSKQHG